MSDIEHEYRGRIEKEVLKKMMAIRTSILKELLKSERWSRRLESALRTHSSPSSQGNSLRSQWTPRARSF